MQRELKRLAFATLAVLLLVFLAGAAGAQDYGLRKAEIEIEGMT